MRYLSPLKRFCDFRPIIRFRVVYAHDIVIDQILLPEVDLVRPGGCHRLSLVMLGQDTSILLNLLSRSDLLGRRRSLRRLLFVDFETALSRIVIFLHLADALQVISPIVIFVVVFRLSQG